MAQKPINTRGVPAGDLVAQYLAEVARHPLLTREEEAELAPIIRAYLRKHPEELYTNKSKDVPDISRVELLLGKDPQPGKRKKKKRDPEYEAYMEARRKFVVSNLRLVASIAFKYAKGTGTDVGDLLQEGNIGLLRAVEKFDERKGFKFSTYASWWIRQAMTRYIANNTEIRIPIYKVELQNQMKQTYGELTRELGRAPTMLEVAEAMGLDEKDIESTLRIPGQFLSLDTPLGEGERTGTVEDTLEDPNGVDPEDRAITEDTRTKVLEIIQRRYRRGLLSDRDKLVLELRFGLSGQDPMSLDKVGQHVDLTRERVRQIIASQLKAMKLTALVVFRE